MKVKIFLVLFVVYGLFIPQFSIAQSAQYEIIDLGIMLNPVDVNNEGDVVGSSIVGNRQGFIWSAGKVTQLKGEGITRITPRAVNDSKVIAGSALHQDGLVKPLLINNNQISTSAFNGVLTSINSSGMSTGSISYTDGTTDAILLNNSEVQYFNTQADSNVNSKSINVSGKVVGFFDTQERVVNGKGNHSTKTAFISNNKGINELGTLGGDSSYALSINKEGKVVGSSEIKTTETISPKHAFLWEDGVMTDIGTLCGDMSEARDINTSGDIVGSSSIEGSKISHAVIWKNSIITDLNNLIPENSGWVLKNAAAINDKGWIVGAGYLDEKFHGYLIVPITSIQDNAVNTNAGVN